MASRFPFTFVLALCSVPVVGCEDVRVAVEYAVGAPESEVAESGAAFQVGALTPDACSKRAPRAARPGPAIGHRTRLARGVSEVDRGPRGAPQAEFEVTSFAVETPPPFPPADGDTDPTPNPDPDPNPSDPNDGDPLPVRVLRNFSFIDATLAGMAHPGYDSNLDASLAELADEGIDIIVSLTEGGLPRDVVEARGFTYVHLPVIDFQPPTETQSRDFLAIVQAAEAAGFGVVLHCFSGYGRTGTMMASRLVLQGTSALSAIAQIRAARPGSIESKSQEDFLKALGASLNATP